ncbi:MAG: site-specific DNA-methyltransferase [Candidatus Vogelbacteria bacterium]|nr:site-specific DNA-methyltransferase [Candidatus Vogelbacteria bacterium]
MTKRNYKGSLQLDWINKDLSLYYEIDEKEGKGVRPVWVKKNDIRVAEPRILRFAKNYGDTTSENMLIKGDNLLILRSLVEMFKGKPDKEKVKCIYIDPPFNTGNAFQYYDDNLQHSEWLTMMRDRLYLLKKLLKKDGVIFVHIDNDELHYLKVLMDETFGRENYITTIAMKAKAPSGVATGSMIFDVSQYLLCYRGQQKPKVFKNKIIKEIIDESSKTAEQYSLIFDNEGKEGKVVAEYRTKGDGIIKIKKHLDYTITRVSNGDKNINFYVKNFGRIFRTATLSGGIEKQLKKLIPDSGLYSYVHTPSKGKHAGIPTKFYVYNKEGVLFLKEVAEITEVENEDGNLVKIPAKLEIISNIFVDDLWQGIAGEGGVEFQQNKKPEKLIQRLLDLITQRNDLVLDIFAGSGTTGAVAHKMGRRWLMVEIGRQAEEKIIPRLQRVVAGKDKTGISKEINWEGGGGFKYYQLGDSVIHEQDMNWKMKAVDMAEAVFLHFQYRPVKAEWLEKENMYLGRHQSARYHFALSFASREVKTITEDLYEKIVAGLDKERFKHLTIFTNVAVAVPPDSFDKEKILVKKIPAAILREYNLL